MSESLVAQRAHGPERGVSAFELLANRRVPTVLERLEADRHPAASLLAVLPTVPAPTVYDDLRRLAAVGAVGKVAGARPAIWELRPTGAALLWLDRFTIRLAQRASARAGARCDDWERLVMATLADRRAIAVLRELAVAGPRRPSELERALDGCLTHRGLSERLRFLATAGVLERRAAGRATTYEIVPAWRPLGCSLAYAAWWEWRVGRPAHPQVASDLAAIARLIAPLARLRDAVRGACVLAVDHPDAPDRAVRVDVHDRRLSVAALPARHGRRVENGTGGAARAAGGHGVRALVAGSPDRWADALVTGRAGRLLVRGDRELAGAVVDALAAPLAAVIGGRPRRAISSR